MEHYILMSCVIKEKWCLQYYACYYYLNNGSDYICKLHCSVWGYFIMLLFDGDWINITLLEDEPLFPSLILESTCQPDHLVHLQSCRPEMQVGKPSRASLRVPSFGLQFWSHFLHSLPHFVPIAKAKKSYTWLIYNL